MTVGGQGIPRLQELAPHPEAVAFGESQGGGAALFAAELAATYAPQVRLLGVAAIDPPSNLGDLATHLNGGQAFGYDLMAVAGFQVAYPELAADDRFLTSAGHAALAKVRNECETQILSQFEYGTEATYGLAAVLHAPDFSKRLTQNTPGHVKTKVPILIVQGSADPVIPVSQSRNLVRAYCAAGDTVNGRLYPAAIHGDIMRVSLPEVISYLQERITARRPPPSVCAHPGGAAG
ncbi:MAG TPA: lipase family protein [Streptosporangiaceae bacterium]|nr:lipase family protein [Streptosporangiaceae bacterium]